MPARPGSALPSAFLAQAEATFTRLAGMPGMAPAMSMIIRRLPACVSFLSAASTNTLFSTDPLPGASRLCAYCTARDIAGVLAAEFGVDAGAGDDETDDPEG